MCYDSLRAFYRAYFNVFFFHKNCFRNRDNTLTNLMQISASEISISLNEVIL